MFSVNQGGRTPSAQVNETEDQQTCQGAKAPARRGTHTRRLSDKWAPGGAFTSGQRSSLFGRQTRAISERVFLPEATKPPCFFRKYNGKGRYMGAWHGCVGDAVPLTTTSP